MNSFKAIFLLDINEVFFRNTLTSNSLNMLKQPPPKVLNSSFFLDYTGFSNLSWFLIKFLGVKFIISFKIIFLEPWIMYLSNRSFRIPINRQVLQEPSFCNVSINFWLKLHYLPADVLHVFYAVHRTFCRCNAQTYLYHLILNACFFSDNLHKC
jgi:hypothetical protein